MLCIRRLAERIAEEGRACVLIVNKWDAVEDKASSLLLCHACRCRRVERKGHSC
jgi:predicted GTPase